MLKSPRRRVTVTTSWPRRAAAKDALRGCGERRRTRLARCYTGIGYISHGGPEAFRSSDPVSFSILAPCAQLSTSFEALSGTDPYKASKLTSMYRWGVFSKLTEHSRARCTSFRRPFVRRGSLFVPAPPLRPFFSSPLALTHIATQSVSVTGLPVSGTTRMRIGPRPSAPASKRPRSSARALSTPPVCTTSTMARCTGTS